MDHVDRSAVAAQLLVAGRLVDRRRELQENREMVRQFAGGRDNACGAVHVGETQQRHAAVAGVTGGVIRQEQCAASFPVERVGILHCCLDRGVPRR